MLTPAPDAEPSQQPAKRRCGNTRQWKRQLRSRTAAEVEVSSIDALNAGAVAVAELVRGKQSTLEDAKSQLAALQEQLATYTAAKDALAAELESRGLSLSDVQTQLESLQGEYAGEQGARGELESKLQELDSQLQAYLVDYGDPEDVAQPAEAPAADAAAQGEVVTQRRTQARLRRPRRLARRQVWQRWAQCSSAAKMPSRAPLLKSRIWKMRLMP